MARRTGSRGGLFAGVVWMVMAALVLIGCGHKEGDGGKGVVVRNPQRSGTTSTASLPSPGVDTLSGSIGGEGATPPDVQKEVTYEQAEAAFSESRYGDAVELFTRYTERKPENPWGHYMLGLSAWKVGDLERAEKAFGRSLELDPLHVKSQLNLSRVLLDSHRPEEALVKIDGALAVDSASSDAHRLRGRALCQLGREDEAADAYRRAIRIDREDAWSMNNLGLIYVEQGLFEKALPPLARAVELGSDVAIFHNNLGMALEHTGRFRAAEDAYRAALAADASNGKAFANLDRVASVREQPGLEPLDLPALARGFVDEIDTWAAAGSQSESFPPDVVARERSQELDVRRTSVADSTGGYVEP